MAALSLPTNLFSEDSPFKGTPILSCQDAKENRREPTNLSTLNQIFTDGPFYSSFMMHQTGNKVTRERKRVREVGEGEERDRKSVV